MKPVKLPPQLEERILREEDDTIRFLLLQELADNFLREGKWGYAFALYEQALTIARKLRDSQLICNTLIDLGLVAENLNQSDIAVKRYNEALKIAIKMQDFRAQRTIYNRLAMQSQSNLAAEYFDKATQASALARAKNARGKRGKNKPRYRRSSTKEFHITSTDQQRFIEVSSLTEQEKHNQSTLRRIIFVAGVLFILIVTSIIYHIVSTSPTSNVSGASIIVVALIVGLLVVIGLLIFFTRVFFSSPHED